MPRPFRNLKIGSFIEQELSKMIAREIEIPGAIITVTGVEVSEELDNTKITLSILPYSKEVEAYKELERRRKDMEYKILRRSKMRIIPKFQFVIDSHPN
jgi:ribosome-binding factor A